MIFQITATLSTFIAYFQFKIFNPKIDNKKFTF